MYKKEVYLFLALIGFVIPYAFFLSFVLDHGLNFLLIFENMFANRISTFFASDVIISAVVLFYFIFSENRKIKIRLLWMPILATILVGVSCGLPLYLYLRERSLAHGSID